MIDISNAEYEVLEVIWQQNPVSADDIIARLNKNKSWHDKTVKTLLNRLVKKEALGFEKQQRKYLYFPLIEKEHYTQSESKSFIERIFGGHLSPLVAGFAKEKSLKKEDIDALKDIIEQWEKDNG